MSTSLNGAISPTAVTADRDQRQPLAGGRVVQRIELLGGEIEQQAQDLVD